MTPRAIAATEVGGRFDVAQRHHIPEGARWIPPSILGHTQGSAEIDRDQSF